VISLAVAAAGWVGVSSPGDYAAFKFPPLPRHDHDGLAALVQSALKEDPFTGTVFVFRAKRADMLKILFWDGTGLVMAYKRLEETTFAWPAIRDGVMALNRAQFEALFAGLDWL
jgi:transposase